MPVDFDDFEYAIPGEHLRTASDPIHTGYDLRTYDQRTDARLDDHQRRIAELEQRLSRLEGMMQPNLAHLWERTPGLS